MGEVRKGVKNPALCLGWSKQGFIEISYFVLCSVVHQICREKTVKLLLFEGTCMSFFGILK